MIQNNWVLANIVEFFGGLPDLLSEEDIRLRPMHEVAEPCLGDKQKHT